MLVHARSRKIYRMSEKERVGIERGSKKERSGKKKNSVQSTEKLGRETKVFFDVDATRRKADQFQKFQKSPSLFLV